MPKATVCALELFPPPPQARVSFARLAVANVQCSQLSLVAGRDRCAVLGCQKMPVQVARTEGRVAELVRDRESELATTEIQNRLASQFGIPGCR